MTEKTKYMEVFGPLPMSRTIRRYHMAADPAALHAAVVKLEAHGANPWVFSADERHFENFAEAADWAAFADLTPAETKALCAWVSEPSLRWYR
jgi:hypothetical protein